MATRDDWKQRVEAWATSGLTATQYGEREGVNPRSLGYWKWRLARDQWQSTEPTPARFVEVRAVHTATFELELAGGRRVHVPPSFDADALRRLIEVLEGAS